MKTRSVRILAISLALAVSSTALAYPTMGNSNPELGGFIVIHIVKNKQTVTHACTGGNVQVLIAGNKNTVTLTGDCAKVSVTGNRNIVTVDGVGEVNVMGNKNTLTWKRGIGGKKAKVSNTGNGNKVRRAPAKK
jgi:hypothetical protein